LKWLFDIIGGRHERNWREFSVTGFICLRLNFFLFFFRGGGAIARIVPPFGGPIGLCWPPLLSVESVVYLRLFSSMRLAPPSTAECSLRSQHREACLKLNSTTLARPDPTRQSSRTSSETRVWSGPVGPRVVEFSCYYWTLVVLHATSSGPPRIRACREGRI